MVAAVILVSFIRYYVGVLLCGDCFIFFSLLICFIIIFIIIIMRKGRVLLTHWRRGLFFLGGRVGGEINRRDLLRESK